MLGPQRSEIRNSRQQFPDNTGLLAVNKRGVEAVAFIDELIVIEAEEVEQGGVPVVVMDDVADGFVAPFVGFAVDVTGFEAAAGHPVGESVSVVIAPPFVRTAVILEHRQPADFRRPSERWWNREDRAV